jgi:uncharacterized protein involved in outer membrane biogenesis
MKKLVTWISEVSQQLRSKLSLGWRSLDRLPGLLKQIPSKLSQIKPSNWSLNDVKGFLHQSFQAIKQSFNKLKSGENQNNEANPRSGRIEQLNQKYLKLPEPFASYLKPAIITICLIAGYAVFGFYLLPAILKAKIPDLIQEETGRNASIAKIEFNPFKLFASIQGFKINEKNGKPFVEFDNFNLDINAFQSIKQLVLVIDEINLKKPIVHLAKDKNSKFNFEDMAKHQKKEVSKKPAEDGEMFPLNLVKLSIKDGKLTWDDKHFAKPVSEEISPINLSASNVSTEPDKKAKLDFNLTIKSGGKLDIKTNLGLNPIFSEGQIKLDKVELQRALALTLSDTAAFDLKGHELFNIDYKVGMDKKNLKVTIKKTRFELRDLQFADKSPNKTLVKTPTFALEADCTATIGKDKSDVVINKAKLDSRDINYSNQLPEPMTVVIPTFSHETDVNVAQSKDGTKVIADKAKISLKNIQFTGLNQGKVEAKLPELILETAYQLGLGGKELEATVTKGKFDIHDLQVSEKGEPKTLIKVPAFGLNGIGVNLKNQEVVIESVTGKNAEVQAWLNTDGTDNYQALFAPSEKIAAIKPEKPQQNFKTAKTVTFTEKSAYDKDKKESKETKEIVDAAPAVPTPEPQTSPAPAAAPKPKKDWLIKVNNLALDNFGLMFEDKTLKKPKPMTAKPINLKLSNYVNKPDAKLPFQLDITVNKTGLIKLKGDAVIAPLLAKVDVDIKGINLEDFQPYVDKFARLDVLDGKFAIDGKLALSQPPEKPLDVKFTGNTGIADLLTRDQIQNKDFIKWDNLTFKDLDVDLLANSFGAKTLLIEKPYAKVTIRKDKTVNFSDIMITDKAKKDNKAKPAKPVKVTTSKAEQGSKPIFKLDKVKIVDGSSDFADLSLILPFAAQIKSLDGGASGISSDQKSTIKVDLKGNAYDLAPVDINGDISPYLGNYNIDLKFDGMPMPLVTPYMVQFSGYKIEKGKLTLDLQYQVEKGKLKAGNKILIDQLELGEQVDNPEAVSLPLELAIVLLKDSDGKIKLDVPLTGSLEDPQFSIGHIVVDALVNVLTKIVTAPFNALASLAGSDEDLSTVAFKAGNDTLDAKEMGKLDGVAKALKEKTALSIEIKGAAFEAQDWPELQDEALLDQLKKRKADELTKEEGKRIRPEYVELTEDDYNDLLADAYIEKFPTEGEKSIFGTPKLKKSDSDDFYKVAKKKMQEIIKPDSVRLKELASNRARTIAKYIVQKGGIPNERVFILDTALDPKREGKDIVSALSLKTN